MDREAGGMSKSPNVAAEDDIGLDLEDGHSGCRGLSEGGEGVGDRHWVYRLLFPISRLSLSKKSTSAISQKSASAKKSPLCPKSLMLGGLRWEPLHLVGGYSQSLWQGYITLPSFLHLFAE
jgi:hypothetical protein